MELSRRDFLKASGASVGSVLLLRMLDGDVARAAPTIPLRKRIGEKVSICASCA